MNLLQWLRQLRHRPQIPASLWQEAISHLSFLHRLDSGELARLKKLCESLLATKTVTGAAGLNIGDEMAVLIAAQACLPVLNLTLALYDDMPGIIVYPAAFIVPHNEIDEAGVVHEWHEPLCGEAVQAGGAVVLSWEDVENPEYTHQNVVIHEFTHKIDMASGAANGCPPFLPRLHASLDSREWTQVFSTAFEDLNHRIAALEHCLPPHLDLNDPVQAEQYDALFATLPVDPYASQNPAEFFAVVSEAFFVQPKPLADAYPAVYRLLAAYYRQAPLDAG